MRVFLIHGMGRTIVSMALLGHRLREAGYRTTSYGYVVARRPFDDIVDRFASRVETAVAADRAAGREDGFAIVGHSLGNLIARAASPRFPPGFRRFAMLAPPNRPPSVVRALGDRWLFRVLTRDTGRKLADPAFFDRLPVPAVESLILAGNKGPRLRRPFDGAANDAVLRVSETRLADIPVLEVPAIHTFLMNRRDVTAAVLDFLSGGPRR